MLSEVERIGSDADTARFKDTFDKQSYFLIATHDKPSSKEVVECLTNIMFDVTNLDDTAKLLGRPLIILPEYTHLSRVIYSLTVGKIGPYTDNLCYFRRSVVIMEKLWLDARTTLKKVK